MTGIAGVDEAGRGPLAGAVYAAAVMLDPTQPIAGLKDSKQLSAMKRLFLANQIKQQALTWCVAKASVEEIDALNILQATLLAMRRAILGLTILPDVVWIDGCCVPNGLSMPVQSMVRGDQLVPAISAASILAKTERDAALFSLDAQYPQYGFARHKGYPTSQHLAAIAQYGITPVHRKSFAPIKQLLAQS
ncbi:MAG: ribonuclease HII [Neisseriales bacterium]|nr:MAG: ribonuclease HII [Neisseriales bacterium]